MLYKDVELVSITEDNPLHRYSFGDAFARAAKLANALSRLGVKQGDCIGTLAWNDYRHFETYYAVSCMGAICHTINPRLFKEQIDYIVNHAEDRWLMLDVSFVPLLEALESKLSHVEGYIILVDEEHMPQAALTNAVCYETLIKDEPEHFDWPELDENTASSMCYTSGTTGNPKGVLYSHRSAVLHSLSGALPGAMSLSSADVIMPVVPMFHVNAWGLPYTAAMVGAKLVLPGPRMGDSKVLHQLIEQEGVTVAAAVPTVWLSILSYLESNEKSVPSLRRAVIGGAACPSSLIETFADKYGVFVQQGWGMTELSPLGAIMPHESGASLRDEKNLQAKVGKPIFGVEMKIVDETGDALPWNGSDAGSLMVRGPWVCAEYFKAQSTDAEDTQDWFDTGDVATIDPQGYVQITDRKKDIIKSGGEWISSIELEQIAMEHPGVAEAAVIGIAHPKWNERPLLCVVSQSGFKLSSDEIMALFEGKVAKWWIPDDCVFMDGLPHTATGKVSKKDLREVLKDYSF